MHAGGAAGKGTEQYSLTLQLNDYFASGSMANAELCL
jgi:hypothetical protein